MKIDLWTMLGLGAQGLFFGRFFSVDEMVESINGVTAPTSEAAW